MMTISRITQAAHVLVAAHVNRSWILQHCGPPCAWRRAQAKIRPQFSWVMMALGLDREPLDALVNSVASLRAENAQLTRALESEAASVVSAAQHEAMRIDEPHAPWPLLASPNATVATLFHDERVHGASTAVTATVRGPGWRVWRPMDRPWPLEHPVTPGEGCMPGALRLRLPNVSLAQPMCLARGDLISDHIRTKGRWRDCGMHVRLWQSLDARGQSAGAEMETDMAASAPHDGNYSSRRRRARWLPLPRFGDPEGVLLEVGANIGACTVEMLLRTRAKVIAFEPSPLNLFYLTRSLRMLADRFPMVARRVAVFPLAASDAPGRLPLVIERGNLGNSGLGTTDLASDLGGGAVHGSAGADQHGGVGHGAAGHGGAGHGAPSGPRTPAEGWSALLSALHLNATVTTLSQVFPHGLGGVRAIKLDTQGHECHVLMGARAALAQPSSHRVQLVTTEVAAKMLRARCCRPLWLTHLMRTAIGTPPTAPIERLTRPGFQYGTFNVSCLGAYADENTCIARRFNISAALGSRDLPQHPVYPVAPLVLPDERRQLPLRRFHLQQVAAQMRACRRASRARGKRFSTV